MKEVIVFVMIGILITGGVFAVNEAFIESGEDNEITAETFNNPTAGTVIFLDESNVDGAFYDPRPEVRNSSGDTMVKGTDYSWNESNGTLKPLAGGELAGEPSGEIDYMYDLTTQEERDIAQVLGHLYGWMPHLLYIAPMVMFLLIIARVF